MLETLLHIDTAPAKKLAKMRQEQDVLRGFVQRVKEEKDKVSAIAFQRVLDDYESRYAVLEKQAEPLRDEARREYQKLRSVYEQFRSGFDRATVDKQELELRHVVGELTPEQLAERLLALDHVLRETQSALGDANRIRQEFLAAFGSDEELERAEDTATFLVDATSRMDREKDSVPFPSGATSLMGETDDPFPFGAGSSMDREKDSESSPLGSASLIDFEPILDTNEDEPVITETEEAAPPSPYEQTAIEPRAVLIGPSGGPPLRYALGNLNYIGRTPDNQVRLVGKGISRKHAVLRADPKGFVLKDLDSENGTFVNDERVTECVVNPGDRIRIAGVELVFSLS